MIKGLIRSTALKEHSLRASFRSSLHCSKTSHAAPPATFLPLTSPGLRAHFCFRSSDKGYCRHRSKHSLGIASSQNGNGIIVEGYADKMAVQRAVSCAVFVLGSSTWVEGKNSATVLAKLRQGLPNFQKTYVLMDPDFAGRKGRNILESTFPEYEHAHKFEELVSIDNLSQTSSSISALRRKLRWHEAGNIGVEHASPTTIRDALANSRLASLSRAHFTRDKLMSLGLTASYDDPLANCMRKRRDMVCNYLGIGSCDGKQLLRQLNVYNFTDEDLARALQCEGKEDE